MRFCDFAVPRGVLHLPVHPLTVCSFLGWMHHQGYAFGTAKVTLAALNALHQFALPGQPSPVRTWIVNRALRTFARHSPPPEAKLPLLADDLLAGRRAFCEGLSELDAVRQWAVLLFGFGGAFRRSEIVVRLFEQVTFADGGMYVAVPYSKTHQYGEGPTLFISPGLFEETCPVRATREWIARAKIRDGYLFRRLARDGRVLEEPPHADWVRLVVKRFVTHVGLDPGLFAARSLRAGWITSAVNNGVPTKEIQRFARDKSARSLLPYVRTRRGLTAGWSAFVGL